MMTRANDETHRRPCRLLPGWVVLAFTLWAGAAAADTPESLELAPGFEPDPVTRSGVAGGPENASTLGTGPMGACVGWIPAEPHFAMTLTEPFDFFEVAVESPGDTVLVVEGPVGYWCNDDSYGLNPALFGRWAEGDYRIWVGTYHSGQSPPFTITFTGHRDRGPGAGPTLPDP